jgi:glycerol-3-phosphate acyltransferase PlsY
MSAPLIGLAIVATAYIIGTIPFGLVFARWTGAPDPRTKGSGNIGSTNILRVAGTRAATLTLVMDALKGALPVWMTGMLLPGSPEWMQTSGIAAVAGHVFPVWTGFRGGKGVATGIGALVVLSPMAAIVVIGVWALVLGASRYVSLASVTAAAVLPLVSALTHAPSTLVFASVVAAIVIVRHRENLVRLRRGTESKLGARSS